MGEPGYPPPVVLVGLMGSGKTTVGQALAGQLGYRFVDNDAGIEAEYDETVRELEDRLGVGELHRIEAAQLENALASSGSEPVVIAAAASVVEDEGSRALLSRYTVVWLQAAPSYLVDRVRESDHRPHGRLDRRQLTVQAALRHEHFESVADLVVGVEGRSVHGIVEEIYRHLALDPGPAGPTPAR